jgi:uncharacterized protein YecE (DUF72 family)
MKTRRNVISKNASFHIGTSGWHYKHWKGPFYPEDFAAKDFLRFYADSFDTVEINNSFYHLPEKSTFTQWRKTVDRNFIFAVKASRYITHMKKLKNPEEGLSNFYAAANKLKDKFGPVLFQLPPYWHINAERLEAFMAQLPQQQCAFEFRDESWFDEKIYNLLSKFNCAFCIYDLAGRLSPEIVTADYIYIRLHGPDPERYHGNYPRRTLNAWAKKFNKWAGQGKEIYCYFDNDQEGCAVKNALTLRELVNS